MSENTKKIKIVLKDRVVTLIVDEGDSDVDTEDILRIDEFNKYGEILTFSVWINRAGIMKAQAENALREKKFEVDIYKANLTETFRKSLTTYVLDAGGNKKAKVPVNDAVDNAVLVDSGYQAKMRELFRAERNLSYVESFYWSIKSKDDKLRMMPNLTPEDFEQDIIDGVVNGIHIKSSRKPFTDKVNKK